MGKKNLSIDEIMASCRKVDGGGDSDAANSAKATAPKPAAEPTAETPAAEVPASAQSPAAKPPVKAAGGKPAAGNVADILAAARAEKAGGSAATKPAVAKPAASEKPAAKPAATEKAAAAKPAAAKAEKPAAAAKGATTTVDTASILAAARGGTRPGPITKAEAAARAKQAGGEAAKPKPVVPPLPTKPDYARRPAAQPVAAATRRGFISTVVSVFLGSSLAVGFTTLAVTHLLWLLGLARFMFPNILTEPPTKFKVGFPADYGPGQVETKYIAQFGVWIVRYEYEGAPQIYALQSVCTHLGCTPSWLEGEQKFKCPCHGSGFYKDGINFEGPAPRPLERFAIRLADDGQLEVDKSRTFKEEIGQWADPASYVSV